MNTQTPLHQQKCVPCEGGVPPLSKEEAETRMAEVPGWSLDSTGKSISRAYTFRDFAEALTFVNKVGAIAEEQGHHPDIHLTGYKHVLVELSTHAIDGLSENDLIVASKIDNAE